MPVYQKEFQRLKSVKNLVKSTFGRFGVNKKQEITRLLYEISKRENLSPLDIPEDISFSDYAKIKEYLLRRRYPEAFLNSQEELRPYLPKIELRVSDCVSLKKRKFYPKKIFIETKAYNSSLAKRFREIFPGAQICRIKSFKKYRCSNRRFELKDYNKRQDTVFIVNENHDFFKRCPCTKGALGCGYNIFNLGFGCIFECTYCYLQAYTNSPGIILPANIDSFFDKFNSWKRKGMRIGTGEFSDSLMLDELTEYSFSLIDFFKKHKDVTFEFKTKSRNINNLLKARHAGNIVVSWSLNPQRLIEENEYFTSPLEERIGSAVKCVEAGYKVGFHFDPVIYFRGWRKDYARLIDILLSTISPRDIAWISIGTFRFSPGLKQAIERRFPQNKILDEELLLGYDNKLRYPYNKRYFIYKFLIEALRKRIKSINLYLCMEEYSMWRDLGLRMPKF